MNTLWYPKAALLAICVALLTYNVLSVMKTAMRSAHRDPSLLLDLSGGEDRRQPPPTRTGGLREKHVSTARLLHQRLL